MMALPGGIHMALPVIHVALPGIHMALPGIHMALPVIHMALPGIHIALAEIRSARVPHRHSVLAARFEMGSAMSLVNFSPCGVMIIIIIKIVLADPSLTGLSIW